MFSQTSEYALRAVACLARRPGQAMTTRQIAIAARVPADYLAKILQSLARAGIVTGQRGLRGGFVLARQSKDLTLLDVVRVADGSRRITACPLGIPEHGPGLCPLHRRLDDAVALAEQTLSDVTVADVLSEPLCGAETARDARRANDAECKKDGARPCRPDRAGTPRLSPPRDRIDSPRTSPLCNPHALFPHPAEESKPTARSA